MNTLEGSCSTEWTYVRGAIRDVLNKFMEENGNDLFPNGYVINVRGEIIDVFQEKGEYHVRGDSVYIPIFNLVFQDCYNVGLLPEVGEWEVAAIIKDVANEHLRIRRIKLSMSCQGGTEEQNLDLVLTILQEIQQQLKFSGDYDSVRLLLDPLRQNGMINYRLRQHRISDV